MAVDAVTNIKGPAARLLELLEECKKEYQSKLVPFLPTTEDVKEKDDKADMNKILADKSVCLSDVWVGEMFKTQWSSVRAILIDNINRISVKAKEAIDQLMYNFTGDNFLNLLVIKLLDICEQIVTQLLIPFDSIYTQVIYTYNSIVRTYNKFKSLKNDPEQKQALKKQVGDMLRSLGEEYLTVITLYFSIDAFKDLFNTIKGFWNSGKEAWQNVINKFKDLHSILDEVKDKFGSKSVLAILVNLLGTLIPLIASLAAGIICGKKCDAEIKKAAGKTLDEANEANGITDFNPESSMEEIKRTYSNLSLILDYALRDFNGYSLYFNENNELTDESNAATSQIISICYVPRNYGDYTDRTKKRYVLELGKDLTAAYFNVKVGQIISYGQVIGYSNGTKILSRVNGRVIDYRMNHIIVEDTTEYYNTDSIVNDCEYAVNTMNMQDDFSPIVDKFKKLANAETYIRDFALRSNLPDLALHSKGNGTYMVTLWELLLGNKKSSKDKFLDDYLEMIEKREDTHQKNIKKLCDSDRIQTAAENNNVEGIQDQIISEKKRRFNEVLYDYNNWIRYSTKWCAEEADSYMLLADYLNFISDKSVIYDEENEFEVELFRNVRNFIHTRMNLEGTDKSELISAFNTKCKNLLGTRLGTKDYYNYFNGLFRQDWYLVDEDDVVIGTSIKKDDENYDSLYTKMYNYIMNKLKCGKITRGTETLDTSVNDINSFIRKTDTNKDFSKEDKKIIEKQNDAKSICRYFLMIRNMSNSYSLKGMKPSLQALKTQTQTESKILREIFTKALNSYNQNISLYDRNNLYHIFDQFREITCPYVGTIYIDNIMHTHYVYSESVKDMSEANKYATPLELDSMCSAKTENDIRKIHYWLLYCAMATLVNCMLPIYWSTGLNIAGVPILLPIIYLPIYYLPGSVGVLFGLGICGIAIWPMILFINNTAMNGSILIPINIVIDLVKSKLNDLSNSSIGSLKLLTQPFIDQCDDEITLLETELQNTDNTITKYKLKISEAKNSKVQAKVYKKEGN